ncbi:hypothetical protein AC229_0669 [Oenococcus oeni]|nr:hypothetical protein AC229_0669 [Oenococcus oeni]
MSVVKIISMTGSTMARKKLPSSFTLICHFKLPQFKSA